MRLDLNNKTDIIDNYGNGSGTNGHVAAFAEGAVHTVDRDAPLAPTLILSAAFDTGISSSDGITNVTTPMFTGTAEVGSTVTVTSSVNGLLGSTSTDGKGGWSFTPGAALDSNTTHSVSATAKDAAGNESVTSDALTVTIDTTVPYATDIAPHVNAEAGDASVVFSIEFNESVFGLTANSFSVVTLDGSAAGTVSSVVAAEGGFDVTVDDISGAGQLRLDVNAGEGTDVAGNLLQAYTAGSAHPVDRVAPGITGVSFEHDSVNTGNQSSISIVLSGAEIGTTANYTISSSAGGTPVTGTGSITDANQQIAGINVSSLPDGTLTVSVTLTDAAGNVTPTPVSATVEKDTVTPSVTSVEIADGDLREGDVITVSITLSEDVTVSGTSSTLAIDIGGDIRQATFVSENNGVLTYQYTVQAGDNTDADGVRIATSPGSLSLNGDTVADGAGNQADLGFAAVYNPDAQVDTEVPATPAIAVLAPADDTGVSDSDNITSVAQPTLSGTAEPDSAITIYSDVDGVVGNPTADGAGNWSLTLPVALSDNTHQITVVATDAAGNDSLASDPLTLVIDTTDPVITSVSFDQAVVDGTNYQNLSVTLAGAEVGTVVHYTITSDGGAGELTGSVTVTDAGQSITGLNVSSLPDGTLSISVKLVDTAGNESTAVTDAISKNVNPVLALPVNPAPIVDGSDAALPGVVISGTASASIVVELSVGADEGILTLEAQGATLTGNGSGNVTVTGTLTQVNDTLATLEYTAPENFTTASSGAVSVLIEVDDGVGTVADQIDIDVYDRPDIENLQDNTVSLIRGSSNKVAIDAGGNATVSDLDNPHFNGGSLRVTISAGGNPAQDLLSFLNDGAVTLDPDTALANSDVQVDDGTSVAVIGVLAHDISEGQDLVINLNANATPARVELALQSLAYSNSAAGATLGARTLSIELFDGSYADAIRVVTTSVSVQDAPAEGGNNVIDDNQSDVTVIGTVTVTENGVLNGGTITGTITNRGIVTGNVTLGANSFINGGTVSGNINGNAGQPARINDAIITSEASLSNVIIGVGTMLEPGVTIGENVRFESEASIPAGLDLSAALRTLNWSSGDARGVVMLDGNVFTEGSADDDMTILRAIQLLGDYEPAGNDVEQDSLTGEILVVTSDFNAAVLPVQVSKAGPDEIPGTYINDNGDIVFVTVNQRVVLSYPVLASKPAFLAMLQSAGLQLHYDERANMQVYNPSVTVIGDRDVQAVTGEGGEYYYSARPDVLSLPAHRSRTPGLVEYPLAGLGSPTGLSLVFEEGGELREQDLVPASPDWFSLKDALLAIDGISAVSIDTQGILSVTLDGQTLKARLEYVVFIGRETARDNILIRDVGDKTGNGRTDYEIVYTNGDVQYLYVY